MLRRPAVILTLVCIAVVLVVSPPISPTQATGCAAASPTDFHSEDGQWLVLEVNGCSEGLNTYDQQGHSDGSVNVQHRINSTYDSYLRVFAASSDGGWWFISNRGRAYRFSSDFQYENQTKTLPIDSDRSVTGFDIDSAGRWWVTTHGETTVYDPKQNETVRTVQQGATDIVVRDGHVWLLTNRHKGGLVHEYVLRENAGRPTLNERATHELGPEVFHPTLLSRGADGTWWVYSRHGNAFAYEENWQYTGERAPSSSRLSGLFMLFPPVLLSGLGFLFVTGKLLRNSISSRLYLHYIGMAAVATVFAVNLRESMLPPLLAGIYRLPDAAVAGVLVASVAGQALLLEKYSVRRVALVTVANAPLLVVAWDFATSVVGLL